MSSFSSAWETPSKKSSSSNSEDEIITGIAKLWLNSAESNVCDFSLENASQNQENAAVPARELLVSLYEMMVFKVLNLDSPA